MSSLQKLIAENAESAEIFVITYHKGHKVLTKDTKG